jgi:hypothetical protein
LAQFDQDAFGSSKFDDRCLALATTLLVLLNDPRPIEEGRAIIRAEAFLCKRRSTPKHAGYTAMAGLGGGGHACEPGGFS